MHTKTIKSARERQNKHQRPFTNYNVQVLAARSRIQKQKIQRNDKQQQSIHKSSCPLFGRPFARTKSNKERKDIRNDIKHHQTIIISSFWPVVHVYKNTKETALHKITHQRLIISSCWPYARAYKRHKKHKEPHIINGTSKHNKKHIIISGCWQILSRIQTSVTNNGMRKQVNKQQNITNSSIINHIIERSSQQHFQR